MKMRRTRVVLREGRMEERVTGREVGVRRGWVRAVVRFEGEGGGEVWRLVGSMLDVVD